MKNNMPLSTRMKGKAAILKIATVDYSQDCSKITLEPAEGKADVVTFADAAAGGAVTWSFTIDALQSTSTGSLWTYLWGAAGTTGVAYDYFPNGGVASATNPHYTGLLDIGPKPPIGGSADSTFVFTVVLDCQAEPVKAIV